MRLSHARNGSAGVALAALLLLAGPASTLGQERGEADRRGSPPTSGSTVGDVFFGAGHVEETRNRIHGGSLRDAAANRARRAGRPGEGLGRPAEGSGRSLVPDPGEGERARDRRPSKRRFLHPAGGRFVGVYPAPTRRSAERVDAPPARYEERRAVRRSAVEAGDGDGAGAAPDPGVPTAVSGRIGRHLRQSSGEEEAGPGVACVQVRLETRSGIGFDARIDPGALGVEGPGEVGRLLRLKIDEGEALVLPLRNGRQMELSAGGVDAVVAGPCR